MKRRRDDVLGVLQINDEIGRELLPNTILVLIGLALSIFGNVVVMFIHWKKLNSSANFRMLIPFLALSDCIASLVCSTISIYHNFNWLTWNSKAICKASWFGMTLVQTNSAVFLFVIAVQRYLKICHPVRRPISQKKKIACLLSAVVYLSIESVPFILFSDVVAFQDDLVNGTVYECQMLVNYSHVHVAYRYIDDSVIVIIVVVVTFLYAKSGLVLSALSKNAAKSEKRTQFFVNQNSAQDLSSCVEIMDSISVSGKTDTAPIPTKMTKSKCRKYRNINIMFILITGIALLVYIPRIVFNILEMHDKYFWRHYSYSKIRLFLAIKRLYLAMYVVNPVIYSIMDYKFRSEFKRLIRCGVTNGRAA